MTFDPDDRRWTQWVLDPDSLSAHDRKLLQEELQADTACQEFVDQLREGSQLLTRHLQKEPCVPILSTGFEAAVLGEMNKPRQRQWARFTQGLAALLLTGLVGVSLWPSSRSQNQQAGVSTRELVVLKSAVSKSPDGDLQAFINLDDSDRDYSGLIDPVEAKPLTDRFSGRKSADKDRLGTDVTVSRIIQKESSGAAARAKEFDGSGKVGEETPAVSPFVLSRPVGVEANITGKHLAKESPKDFRQMELQQAQENFVDAPNAGNAAPLTVAREGLANESKVGRTREKSEFERPAVALELLGADVGDGLPPKPVARSERLELEKGSDGFFGEALRERYVIDGKLSDREATKLPNDGLSFSLERNERRLHTFKESDGFIRPQVNDSRVVNNTEAYPTLIENPFHKVEGIQALSTFSIDVDTASYSNVRRFLQQNMLPPVNAVRIEELINYFPYSYSPPSEKTPFAVHVELGQCPWNHQHRLARVALKGRPLDIEKRPASNLVFLIDISGSMDQPNKLPLVKSAIRMLINQLTENDRVAMAVYASGSGLALSSTDGSQKETILNALDQLHPSGSTNGAAGIQVAYEAAVNGFIKGGTNRVILCTDGDFNVGISNDDELGKLITEKAKTGVFLSVLGFGMGNLKDAKMMQLANKGNGNYAYIDSLKEAHKVLVEQMTGTLVTIAKDVKIQIEFNPQKVASYRLIGYEKRMLKAEDFKDDTKDAGEIGAGHTVTALYELIPAGQKTTAPGVDPLVFQPANAPVEKPAVELDPELSKLSFRVKLRYKEPEGITSTEVAFPGLDKGEEFKQGTVDFRFAATVAAFGMLLRQSVNAGDATFEKVQQMAESSLGPDTNGYRVEFLDMVRKAAELSPRK